MNKPAILIIDDEADLRKTLSDVLRAKGYETYMAASGAEGLALLGRQAVNVALIDLKMPDMPGLEVLARVRAAHPDTEAIIITGNATLDSAIEATNKGAFSYLRKPYEMDQLLMHIRHAVEKQEAAERIRQYQEHLEELVSERTRELESARDAAEAVNRAKSDFLANMSHEMITPLNAIIGFSRILQDELYGPLNEKQREYVADVQSSGQHLFGMISDMLDLARMNSGAMALRVGRFMLKDLLQTSIQAVYQEAMMRHQQLTLDLRPEADREIEADADKLKQVMVNLLGNAVKFTPEGGQVYVQARLPTAKVAQVPMLEISVSDSGIGISSEDLPRLFQEMTQLASPYTKRYGGAGVGLMLAKKLVELHGGRMWAASELGRGSTFSFVIPSAAQPTFARKNIQAPGSIN